MPPNPPSKAHGFATCNFPNLKKKIIAPPPCQILGTPLQPYRDVINFALYIYAVYSYSDINFTYLYMRTNYLRHLANIVDILWSRPVWGGGGGATLN